MKYIFIIIALVAVSCQTSDDHEHSQNGEDGHAHGTEEITVDHTIWTDQTELFVEFPALIVGKTSKFAAHFTMLDGHTPIRKGSVSVSLIKGRKGIRHTVDSPSSPGIFTPSLKPKEAGVYKLIFNLETPDYSDEIVLDSVRVFNSIDEAKKSMQDMEESAGAISFLKEQAWKMEFQTAPAVNQEIYDVIKTSGIWKVSPLDNQTIIAPTDGQVVFNQKDITEGTSLKKGDVLFTISSEKLTTNNLSNKIRKAKAEFEQAEAEYDRKKELYESDIVSKAELEQVKKRYLIAKSDYEALKKDYSATGKIVKAPFNGYIKSINVNNGDFVDQGTLLVVIAGSNSNMLEINVSQSFNSELKNIKNIWYQTNTGNWSNINDTGGKVLSISKSLNNNNPMLKIFAELQENIEMPEGSYTEAQISVGTPAKGIVVPASSLLEDYGNYSVIVQLSGEKFERRNVITGRRNGNLIEIKQGLKPGEFVVTKGAYQVKMASMTGEAPAHGHAH